AFERDGTRGPAASHGCCRGDEMSPKSGTGKYGRLLAKCRSLEAVPTAVAYPCEETALAGAIEAGDKGLIDPILVGPVGKIAGIAKSSRIDLGRTQVIDA